MRKFIAIFVAAALCAAVFTACSDSEQKPEETTTTAAENQPEESGSDEAGGSEDEGGSDDEGGSEDEGGDNESEDGAAQKILDTIRAAYGDNYLPNAEIPEEILTSMYGLDPDTYTEIAAEMPMISTNVDTVIIVKAADGKTGDVKAALDAYRDSLVNDSFQYPMNVAKVNASKVVANGDYVAFLLLGAIDERDDASDSERAEFAEEQVKIGVDAFNGYFD